MIAAMEPTATTPGAGSAALKKAADPVGSLGAQLVRLQELRSKLDSHSGPQAAQPNVLTPIAPEGSSLAGKLWSRALALVPSFGAAAPKPLVSIPARDPSTERLQSLSSEATRLEARLGEFNFQRRLMGGLHVQHFPGYLSPSHHSAKAVIAAHSARGVVEVIHGILKSELETTPALPSGASADELSQFFLSRRAEIVSARLEGLEGYRSERLQLIDHDKVLKLWDAATNELVAFKRGQEGMGVIISNHSYGTEVKPLQVKVLVEQVTKALGLGSLHPKYLAEAGTSLPICRVSTDPKALESFNAAVRIGVGDHSSALAEITSGWVSANARKGSMLSAQEIAQNGRSARGPLFESVDAAGSFLRQALEYAESAARHVGPTAVQSMAEREWNSLGAADALEVVGDILLRLQDHRSGFDHATEDGAGGSAVNSPPQGRALEARNQEDACKEFDLYEAARVIHGFKVLEEHGDILGKSLVRYHPGVESSTEAWQALKCLVDGCGLQPFEQSETPAAAVLLIASAVAARIHRSESALFWRDATGALVEGSHNQALDLLKSIARWIGPEDR